jgi:hypothetical protein
VRKADGVFNHWSFSMRRNPTTRTDAGDQRVGGAKPMSGLLQEGDLTAVAADLDLQTEMLEPESDEKLRRRDSRDLIAIRLHIPMAHSASDDF